MPYNYYICDNFHADTLKGVKGGKGTYKRRLLDALCFDA